MFEMLQEFQRLPQGPLFARMTKTTYTPEVASSENLSEQDAIRQRYTAKPPITILVPINDSFTFRR